MEWFGRKKTFGACVIFTTGFGEFSLYPKEGGVLGLLFEIALSTTVHAYGDPQSSFNFSRDRFRYSWLANSLAAWFWAATL